MKLKFLLSCLFAFAWLIPCKLTAEEEIQYSLSGYIKDAANGEVLLFANLVIVELNTGASTNQYDFQIDDTAYLEFQCIDSISYSYYSQINDMALPGFISATPYNPIGNFDNGALGYFGIYYSEDWVTIIAADR